MIKVLAISNIQVIFEYKNMFWSYSDLDKHVFDIVGIARTINHFNEYAYGYLNNRFTHKQLETMAKGAEELIPERIKAIKEQLHLTDKEIPEALRRSYLAELNYFNNQTNKKIFAVEPVESSTNIVYI